MWTSADNVKVAVPEKVAVKLSYPERVNKHNIEAMRNAIINGSKMHPGANLLETKNEYGHSIRLALHVMRHEEARRRTARNLKIGDIVHRHLRDGE